ncbi:MAG: DUF6049 family protein [Nocardioides sp.]|uniref:DUF6049 family protein n=1 Tax=Nocardioides sp. TaxID=35761 RepID=UPI0039E53EF2
MPCPRQHPVRVLAGLLTGAVLAVLLPGVSPAAAGATVAQRRVEETTPLQVAITSLTPTSVPRKGPITVSGTVTNDDTETWTNVTIAPFVGTSPMTTEEQLIAAAATESDATVGERILVPGDYLTVASIDPGQTVSYTLTIPRKDLTAKGVGAPGVYWFGVHALGGGGPEDDNGKEVADGRARTFLPLMKRKASAVTATVVVPIRAAVNHAGDGRVSELERWATLLGTGGRLARLADLASGPGGHDLSWLVDPAVLAAVQQLAAGNPARQLTASAEDGDEGDGSDDADGGESESSSPSAEPSPDDGDTPDEETQHLAVLAADWWQRMSTALQGADVLALPYGDLDLTGAAAHNSDMYALARARSSTLLEAWGIASTPVNAPLGGVINTETVDLLDESDTASSVLISDKILPAGTDTLLVQSDGVRMVAVDAATSSGGPGPDDSLAGTSFRQRVLAEAAVRSLSSDTTPLVVALPSRWSAQDQVELGRGLRQTWLTPQPLAAAISGQPSTAVEPDHLEVSDQTATGAVGQQTFASAAGLIRSGKTLQQVLTGNDQLADATLDEALTTLSYQRRAARTDVGNASRVVLDAILDKIQVGTSRQVTLSGSSGRFAVTITNGLDQSVTVRLKPVTDEGISISTPDPVEIAPGASATVALQAAHARAGVHNVVLVLTDTDGERFGLSTSLPVRAAQVSRIIWLFLAVGAALLFGAIGARLVRRIRKSRRDAADPSGDEAGSETAG